MGRVHAQVKVQIVQSAWVGMARRTRSRDKALRSRDLDKISILDRRGNAHHSADARVRLFAVVDIVLNRVSDRTRYFQHSK